MTKLEFLLSPSTKECWTTDPSTAQIFQLKPSVAHRVPIASLLSDAYEYQVLQEHVDKLTNLVPGPEHKPSSSFETFNLVFSAPNEHSLQHALPADRRPLDGICFRSPLRAVHSCGETELACFCHVVLLANGILQLTALEYSRKHRAQVLRRDFGAWLLEDRMEKAVIATDPMGTVVYWNRFSEILYQYSAQDATGRSIMELTPSQMSQEQGQQIMQALTAGNHWKGMFQVQRKDQTNFMAHVTDTPVLDSEGQLKFIVGISFDYTDMHNLLTNLEEQVQIRTQQVLQQERQVAEAQRKAEQEAAASATKTEMINMLSHEFRTPLQGIVGVCSTSMDGMPQTHSNESQEFYQAMETILASSRLLLTLINNVLDLGKMGVDKMQQTELTPIPLHHSIYGAAKFCAPFATLNEARVIIRKDDDNSKDGDWVIGNRLRLEQVLVNLLSNAIKYTELGTEVVFSTRHTTLAAAMDEATSSGTCSSDLSTRSPKQLEEWKWKGNNTRVIIVSCQDAGGGIPDQEADKLFGEFVQLNVSADKDRGYDGHGATAAQSSGSGLGLNLVSKFLARMNSFIWAKNLDKGAVFSFVLEVASKEQILSRPSSFTHLDTCSSDNEEDTKSSEKIVLLPEDAGRLRAVVLDDSVINLRVLQRMLTRCGLQNIHSFSSAKDALQYLESTGEFPQFIFSDLQMPGMDGFEFLQRLRASNKKPSNSKVIACSADWTEETEGFCEKVGFDNLLRKPITFSVLRDFLAQSAATVT